MNIQYTSIALADALTTVWSGGTTTELFLYPKGKTYKDRTFEARISSATVDLPKSTYTSLPGVDRFLSPLENPFTLSHPGTNLRTKHLQPFEVYAFSGDLPTECEGTGSDFNLMVRGGMAGTMVPIRESFTPNWPGGATERFIYLYYAGQSEREKEGQDREEEKAREERENLQIKLSTGQQLVLSPQTLLLVTLDAPTDTAASTGPSLHLASSSGLPLQGGALQGDTLLGGTIYRP